MGIFCLQGMGMKKILMMIAIILALGAAGAFVQMVFSPLVYAGCPVSPP